MAAALLAGARRGVFFIPVGLDGWMLANVTGGMAPQPSLLAAGVEVLLLPLLRLLALIYRANFDGIVRAQARARGGRGAAAAKSRL